MKTSSEERTVVIFRRWKPDEHDHTTGDIIALFPEINENYGLCQSYMHVGQHGAADYAGVLRQSFPAEPRDYRDLKKELESIGYVLDVRERRPRR